MIRLAVAELRDVHVPPAQHLERVPARQSALVRGLEEILGEDEVNVVIPRLVRSGCDVRLVLVHRGEDGGRVEAGRFRGGPVEIDETGDAFGGVFPKVLPCAAEIRAVHEVAAALADLVPHLVLVDAGFASDEREELVWIVGVHANEAGDVSAGIADGGGEAVGVGDTGETAGLDPAVAHVPGGPVVGAPALEDHGLGALLVDNLENVVVARAEETGGLVDERGAVGIAAIHLAVGGLDEQAGLRGGWGGAQWGEARARAQRSDLETNIVTAEIS